MIPWTVGWEESLPEEEHFSLRNTAWLRTSCQLGVWDPELLQTSFRASLKCRLHQKGVQTLAQGIGGHQISQEGSWDGGS